MKTFLMDVSRSHIGHVLGRSQYCFTKQSVH